jgi:hypothetical protein
MFRNCISLNQLKAAVCNLFKDLLLLNCISAEVRTKKLQNRKNGLSQLDFGTSQLSARSVFR